MRRTPSGALRSSQCLPTPKGQRPIWKRLSSYLWNLCGYLRRCLVEYIFPITITWKGHGRISKQDWQVIIALAQDRRQSLSMPLAASQPIRITLGPLSLGSPWRAVNIVRLLQTLADITSKIVEWISQPSSIQDLRFGLHDHRWPKDSIIHSNTGSLTCFGFGTGICSPGHQSASRLFMIRKSISPLF